MELTTRTTNDVTVVDVAGSLDTQTSGKASEEFAEIASQNSKLLLNLEKLDFLSSAGLRVLLRTSKQLSGSSGTMKICGATGTVQEVLDISGFGSFLEIYDSEQEALAKF